MDVAGHVLNQLLVDYKCTAMYEFRGRVYQLCKASESGRDRQLFWKES
jgi:hypothetical protein